MSAEEEIRRAVAAWEATFPEDRRNYLQMVSALSAGREADAPDIGRVRCALAIYDSLDPPDWDLAWAFARYFQGSDVAIAWRRAGWNHASAAGHAARTARDPETASQILRERGLTIADVEDWHAEASDYPWDAEGWTPEAQALMAAIRAYQQPTFAR
jgi:hypothetical protein